MQNPNHSQGGSFTYDKEGKLIAHDKPTRELSADELQRRKKLRPIVDAIKALDRADKTLFTKHGAPKVPAIEQVLGAQTNEADRDAAWAILQSEEGEKA